MRYSTGQPVAAGDHVLADGMDGIVVCDFDNRVFLAGYTQWDMPDAKMIGGGTLSSGIMINTTEAGLIHYQEGTGHIVFVKSDWHLHFGTNGETED
ncbi:hypothetical protein [Rhizobium sp. ZPR3]|uniref:Uncharacterized protein n=2 Tax=unclassified Rhizobium TaxID=2613769 RepID=A0AAU7SMP4_9HYPH